MANEQNLIPQAHVLTVEESSKGGKASGKARSFKSAMKKMLALNLTEQEVKKQLESIGFHDDELNNQNAIIYKQIRNAINGDIRSAEFCRDTAGEYIGAEEEKRNKKNNQYLYQLKT